jgi:hypothetical protein
MRLIAGNPGKSLILQITEPEVERLREGLDNLLYMTERPSRISEPDRAAVEDLISELQRVRVEFDAAAAAAADSADDAAEAAAWVAYDAAIAAIAAAWVAYDAAIAAIAAGQATYRETKAAEAAAAERAAKEV